MSGKFTESRDVSDWLVKTPSGWQPIQKIHQTIPFQIMSIQAGPHVLRCADHHRVIDSNGEVIRVEDLTPGTSIMTEDGPQDVTGVCFYTTKDRMYDLELADGDRVYYTNHILSHNTFTATAVINHLLREGLRPFLYIVPRIQLVDQTVSAMVDYGLDPEDIGKFYGQSKDLSNPITIATWQSLQSQLKERKAEVEEYLASVKCLIVDEVHGIKAKVLKEIVEKVSNAERVYGVTGTLPDREQNEADNMLVTSILGGVIDEALEKDLIKRNLLSTLTIRIIYIDHDQTSYGDYHEEREHLETCQRRNDMIVEIARHHRARGHNTLVLVEKLEKHGFPLHEQLEQELGTEVDFIHGGVKPAEREVIRKKISESKSNTLLATYGTLQTGVDIPALHCVVLSMIGKSKIRTLQSIGRGLRKHGTKRNLIVYDLADSTEYASKHLKRRITHYAKRDHPLEFWGEKEALERLGG